MSPYSQARTDRTASLLQRASTDNGDGPAQTLIEIVLVKIEPPDVFKMRDRVKFSFRTIACCLVPVAYFSCQTYPGKK
jgi:hypothetical protein